MQPYEQWVQEAQQGEIDAFNALTEPFGGAQGQVSDMMIRINEFQRLKDRLVEIFAEHIHQSREVLLRDMDRDFYFDAQGAVDYGMIDAVVKKTTPLLNGKSNGYLQP